jgi:protein-disulfide isomerase
LAHRRRRRCDAAPPGASSCDGAHRGDPLAARLTRTHHLSSDHGEISTMANKADQKNQARAKREAAQAAAAAAAKRNRNIQILGGILVAAVAVVLIIVVVSGGKKPKSDAKGAVEGVATTTELLKGIPQNGLALGEPDAPITVLELLDVQCPFCQEHELDQQPTVIKNLVRTGKIRLLAQPVALTQMGEDSEAGRAVALRLAHVNKAWDFLNLFYLNQGDEQTGYVTDDYLKKLVAAIPGTNPSQAKRTPDAADEGELKKIQAIEDKQVELVAAQGGSFGTPAFAIGLTKDDPLTYKPLPMSSATPNAETITNAVNKLTATLKK